MSRRNKNIIIHAGLPKTGSTFLQENVFPTLPPDRCAYNPETLQRLLLELCKEVISTGSVAPDTLAALKQRVDSEIAAIAADNLLISIEGFMSVHCGGLATGNMLFEILEQLFDDPVIILVMREQSAWIRSAYSFYLVSNLLMPFAEFTHRSGERSFGARPTAHAGVCVFDFNNEMIRDIASRRFSRILCFRFEDLFSDKQSQVLARLASTLGVERLSVIDSGASNKGLDERQMVLISAVLGWFPFRPAWRLEYIYPRYGRLTLVGKIKRAYLRRAGRIAFSVGSLLYRHTRLATNARLFSEADQLAIKAYYQESNARFWREHDALRPDTRLGQV